MNRTLSNLGESGNDFGFAMGRLGEATAAVALPKIFRGNVAIVKRNLVSSPHIKPLAKNGSLCLNMI
jgi:hypothetical protein